MRIHWHRRDLRVRESPRHANHYLTRFNTMGTTARIEVVAPGPTRAREVIRPAVQAVRKVNRLMSTYRANSDIRRLNDRGSRRAVAVHDWTMDVLRKAVELWRVTGGAFDVTSGPLRDVWRRAEKSNEKPDEEELQAARQLVGADGLICGEGTVRLKKKDMEVDLGGIAKGYAIDRAVRAIKKHGGDSALVDIGGDMRLLGRRSDGKHWRVRVRTPPRITLNDVVYLKCSDIAVATSGDYARYYMVGDKRFSHIVDPRTARPVQAVPSCTVMARTAATADALATGLSVLGPEKGLKAVEKVKGAECLIMVEDQQGGTRVVSSDGFSQYRYFPGDDTE